MSIIFICFYYKNIKILFRVINIFYKIKVHNIKIKETPPTCFLRANYSCPYMHQLYANPDK